MAAKTRKTAKQSDKKSSPRKPARKPKPRPARLVSRRDHDTLSVLDGPMKDAIREAFLKRP